MRVGGERVVVAVGLAAAFAALLYAASTWGVSVWSGSDPAADRSGPLHVPRLLHNAPESVPTEADRGPVGPVGLVFAGTRVLDGLTGEVPNPWLAVSGVDGEYRSLSAPLLPAAGAGAVSVSPAGDRLAWVGGGAVVLHDPLTGTSRRLEVAAASAVGAFSPDGGRLLVAADELTVVDAGSGDVLGSWPVGGRAVRQAAWDPAGTRVAYADRGRLVLHDVRTGRRTTTRAAVPVTAELAWSPRGDRLVSAQQVAGTTRLLVWRVDGDRVAAAGRVPNEGLALGRLLGFTAPDRVAATALAVDTGLVERVFDLPLDGSGPPRQLMTLPGPGENWVDAATMTVADRALRGGAADFAEPDWPWSHRAKLVGSLVVALFGLGLHLTRPRRR